MKATSSRKLTLQRLILSTVSGDTRLLKNTCTLGYSGLVAKSASSLFTAAGLGVMKYTAASGSGSRVLSKSSTTDTPDSSWGRAHSRHCFSKLSK